MNMSAVWHGAQQLLVLEAHCLRRPRQQQGGLALEPKLTAHLMKIGSADGLMERRTLRA